VWTSSLRLFASRLSEIKGKALDTASRPAARLSGSPQGMSGAAWNRSKESSSCGFPGQHKGRSEEKVKGGLLEPQAEAARSLYPLLFPETDRKSSPNRKPIRQSPQSFVLAVV